MADWKSLKDKMKSTAEKAVFGTAEKMLDAIDGKLSGEKQKSIVINDVSDLSKWITSMQSVASRSVAQLLQSQLQVANYIVSPIISGMVLDNILVCLYKSLELADSDQEKRLLQESFAALLQGMIFVSEARLNYEIKKNKDEAMQLIFNANNMMAQSISSTAALVNQAAGEFVGAPIVNNVFGSKVLDKKLVAAANKAADIFEMKANHNTMLNNLFQTLDKYFKIIGPSIQVHGMLSRYIEPLLNYYTESQLNDMESYINKFSVQWDAIVKEMSISLHEEYGGGAISRKKEGMSRLVDSVLNRRHRPDIQTYEELCHIYDFLKERQASLTKQMATHKREMSESAALRDSLGVFKREKKDILDAKIATLGRKASKLSVTAADIDEKLRIVENVIVPIRERVEKYESELKRITEMYFIEL